MSNLIRVGVIGTGIMGAEHARLLACETRGAALVAICDKDSERAASLGFGVEIFNDGLSLINDSSIDAIVIASPDATHAEYAFAAIKAGKPTLCEKPLATTAKIANEIVNAEITSGKRVLQIGYMRRFDHGYCELKSLVTKNSFGPPRLIHNIHRNVSAPDWFTEQMALTNSFVHEIDISRWLLDTEFATIQVVSTTANGPLIIVMKSTDGIVVSTEINVNAHYGYDVRCEVVFEKGTAELPTQNIVKTHQNLTACTAYPADWRPRFAQSYQHQMQAWIQSIKTSKPVGASAWDGYITSLIADTAIDALQNNTPTELNLPAQPGFYL